MALERWASLMRKTRASTPNTTIRLNDSEVDRVSAAAGPGSLARTGNGVSSGCEMLIDVSRQRTRAIALVDGLVYGLEVLRILLRIEERRLPLRELAPQFSEPRRVRSQFHCFLFVLRRRAGYELGQADRTHQARCHAAREGLTRICQQRHTRPQGIERRRVSVVWGRIEKQVRGSNPGHVLAQGRYA